MCKKEDNNKIKIKTNKKIFSDTNMYELLLYLKLFFRLSEDLSPFR